VRNDSAAFGADDNEMRESLNPVTAEQLLDGTADTPPALANLLARAAAPGQASELTGEAAALAAFQAAGRSAAYAPARPGTPVRSRPARRRWLVAVAAAVFTFASAGVAVAAATGIIPNPLGPDTSTPTSSDDTSSRGAPPPGNRGSHPAGPTAPPPDAAVDGLCRAYLAQAANGRKEELNNPRFEALVQLAGGADKVAAYCTARLAEPTPGSTTEPTPGPTHGRPDNHPTGPPTPPQPNKQPAK